MGLEIFSLWFAGSMAMSLSNDGENHSDSLSQWKAAYLMRARWKSRGEKKKEKGRGGEKERVK